MQRIGIFGGTFNPPHIGHLNIANEFIREYSLSKVFIIPTYIPPHKESPNLASADARMEMCELTFSDKIFEVSDIEIIRKGKSYTYDTLCELTRLYTDAQFYFLIGDDMLLTFHEWKNPMGILDLCTVVAALRHKELTEEKLIEYISTHYPDEYKCGKFELLHIEPLELSSTEVREKAANGEAIEGLVTQSTFEYIKNRGLYHA